MRKVPVTPGRLSMLVALLLVAATFVAGPPSAGALMNSSGRAVTAARHHYHNGTFGQAAWEYCDVTATYTASHRLRTRIVRSTDGWSNTIESRYRRFTGCTAREMTSTVWCTTRLVDGFSKMCITPRPRAGGASNCRHRRLDVRGVYHPDTGVLEITCVNECR